MSQAKLTWNILKNKAKDCWENISLITYILVIFFGVGAWVAINGLWVELPIIVQEIPEGWTLPSYLTVMIQIGNIGPIAFTILNAYYPKKINEVSVSYTIIAIGVVSCTLLSLFWRETTHIAGANRSVALLALCLTLSTVDCTSSVTFVPYMAKLREVYLSPYFLGEGLSGLFPSLVALGQGVGEGATHSPCVPRPTFNSTNSTNQSWGPGPKFSVEVFFWFLTGMMVVCGAAFICLNLLPITRRQKIKNTSLNVSSSDVYELQNVELNNEGTPCKHYVNNPVIQSTMKQNIYLLVVLAVVNGLSNGIIPAIQSYATIPYSYYIYHLTLTLSNIANPVTCLVFPFIRTKSIVLITILSIVYSAMCTYILVVASQSPNVLLQCDDSGAVLMVSLITLILVVIHSIQCQTSTVHLVLTELPFSNKSVDLSIKFKQSLQKTLVSCLQCII